MEGCALCSPGFGPVVARSEHWRLVLNRNQDLLGKCFLALGRHEERVADLTVEEWADLWGQLSRATSALESAFGPDHFNYAFLQNQDRHVHLHVIPAKPACAGSPARCSGTGPTLATTTFRRRPTP